MDFGNQFPLCDDDHEVSAFENLNPAHDSNLNDPAFSNSTAASRWLPDVLQDSTASGSRELPAPWQTVTELPGAAEQVLHSNRRRRRQAMRPRYAPAVQCDFPEDLPVERDEVLLIRQNLNSIIVSILAEFP
jgi:hypothetical protein